MVGSVEGFWLGLPVSTVAFSDRIALSNEPADSTRIQRKWVKLPNAPNLLTSLFAEPPSERRRQPSPSRDEPEQPSAVPRSLPRMQARQSSIVTPKATAKDAVI